MSKLKPNCGNVLSICKLNQNSWLWISYFETAVTSDVSLLSSMGSMETHLSPLALIYFLLQPWQVYGLSLVWRRLCNFRWTNCVNLAGQRSHAYGFWPECSRRWVFRFEVELNLFLHMSHWCGFSPMKTIFTHFDVWENTGNSWVPCCETVYKVFVQKCV